MILTRRAAVAQNGSGFSDQIMRKRGLMVRRTGLRFSEQVMPAIKES
jgi:hypothetical protein